MFREGKFMDRKTLLAISLCFLIYLGWQKLYLQPYQTSTTQTLTVQNPSAPPSENLSQHLNTTAGDQTKLSQSSAVQQKAPSAKRPAQRLALQTSLGEAILGDDGRFFADWTLKGYKLGISS